MRAAEFGCLADVVRDAARSCPEKTAIIFEDREISYDTLDRRSSRVANLLVKLNVAPGDCVALLTKNHALFFDLFFAIPKAGAVIIPINWRLTSHEVAYILQDSAPSIIFVERDLLPKLPESGIDMLTVVVIEDREGFPQFDIDVTELDYVDPLVPVASTDTAMIVYTSGTTGQPKGAMIRHQNFVRHCDLEGPDIPSWQGISEDEIALVVLPLFHVGGLEFALRPLFTRATIVLHREFDVGAILRDIQRHKVTFLGLVPTALQMMLEHPDAPAADLTSIRKFIYGAASIAVELLKQGLERMECEFIQSYGMTEANGTCTMLGAQDHLDRNADRLRSAGKPCFGSRVRILDSEGNDLPPRDVGEIAVSGSGVMEGYWRRPEATREVLSTDGWLRTGDAGFLDEDGYLFICDRVKDMIVSGGENIYPAEVESAIYGHPAVAEVAVVGVPDSLWGEAPRAFIVVRDGHQLDTKDILAWTRERIATFKVPRSIEVVAELPKNATGKILRRQVRSLYTAQSEAVDDS